MFQIIVENSSDLVIGVGPFDPNDDFGDEYSIYDIEDDTKYDNIVGTTYVKYDSSTEEFSGVASI